jgi:sec-independent protein translocase protein TatA
LVAETEKKMPFDLGVPELIIVLVVILIIFGAGKLPQIGGALGKSIKEFKKERGDYSKDKGTVKTIAAPTEEEASYKEKPSS